MKHLGMKHPGGKSREVDPRYSAAAAGPWFAPWPRLTPWFVMMAGLCLGRWVGYTPHLFVAMAASCLLLGLLKSA